MEWELYSECSGNLHYEKFFTETEKSKAKRCYSDLEAAGIHPSGNNISMFSK